MKKYQKWLYKIKAKKQCQICSSPKLQYIHKNRCLPQKVWVFCPTIKFDRFPGRVGRFKAGGAPPPFLAKIFTKMKLKSWPIPGRKMYKRTHQAVLFDCTSAIHVYSLIISINQQQQVSYNYVHPQQHS